ncbi:MAG: hypothetical protein ACLVJO_09260 [[Clostridium] scindens]
MSRIENHIILGDLEKGKEVQITVDGKKISARRASRFYRLFWQMALRFRISVPRNTNLEGIFAALADARTAL